MTETTTKTRARPAAVMLTPSAEGRKLALRGAALQTLDQEGLRRDTLVAQQAFDGGGSRHRPSPSLMSRSTWRRT